ncbi:ABC transporter permease [Vibrio cincinnatiensis]|uniref:Putative ABC transport system permease protein n=1 Tax=Vibrio cincinnatiensis DSM 19608 TaxID=1123491 RepID=A0A1T4KZU6_VIBCI|nr:ABC transporter permease [Vibrio cincinnatiensis]MCG3733097.1 ABC transporter permease [Vibrio cincinnatiensis]MCG3739887.1 ABC transporter permease [Vibrio cincinnatiensis]MCG3743884.1 ABC transporter permease [Vibrio cincinnatiensis]SJZ48004.1 putative ABC transport system permease protein [Vibrio cincinnatiensis DSM 19608]SUP48292.1 putative ABC transporter, permease protein [Vibrio cincinnatiensis]
MSAFAFFGALEIGLIYGLVALGIYLTFRVLDFPDLTVDGSFPMGAAVAATAIVAGINPWLATGLAIIAGAATGWVTAFLTIRCGIMNLLASILTMIAAFSINIRIMGRPNMALLGEETILTPFETLGDPMLVRPLVVAVLVLIAAILVIRLLNSDFGLGLRATGVNARMVAAQGASTAFYTYFCLALSNGFVGFAGALFAQTNSFADVTSGVGTIVVGLAAVILGQTLIPGKKIWVAVVAVIIGSVLYRLAVAFALSSGMFGLQASDLNLVTAVLVAVALVMPRLKRNSKKTRLSILKTKEVKNRSGESL